MFGDKLNELFSDKQNEGNKNNKKRVENLVFFIVLLIITIVIINVIWNGNEQTNKQENNTSSKQLAYTDKNTSEKNNESNNNLAMELENILSRIQGVGEVKVFINYSESSQVVAMYNETTRTSNTQENDTSGGTRKIEEVDSQKDIIYEESDDGIKKPISQKVVEPKVEGAIITAKGANNAEIKANIIQAVEAATGLATHKIQVFEMN